MATNPLYLSGESYGGEYVPHLAHSIMTYTPPLATASALAPEDRAKAAMAKQLRGFLVGNPVFKCGADADGTAMTQQFQVATPPSPSFP